MDTHIYQAWRNPDSRIGYFQDACATKRAIAAMEREFGPVVVGEWSLATDNCAMWLNGFNDNLSGYPRLPCKYGKYIMWVIKGLDCCGVVLCPIKFDKTELDKSTNFFILLFFGSRFLSTVKCSDPYMGKGPTRSTC